MILGGINFALMYRAIVRRQPRAAARDQELRLYLALLVVGAVVIVTEIWTEDVLPGGGRFRAGIFTAVSTMTTTGFSVADYNTWPTLALMTIVGLMFVGGSAGLDDRLGEGRAPPAAREDPPARDRPDAAPGDRPARCGSTAASSTSGRCGPSRRSSSSTSASSSSAPACSPSTPRAPGSSSRAFDAVSVSASMLAQRRPCLRRRRPARLVRAVQRLLDARDDRPDVARPSRGDPDHRPALTPLLAERLAR